MSLLERAIIEFWGFEPSSFVDVEIMKTMSKPNLPTFTFLSTSKLFLKFKIPELPTLIFFNMKIEEISCENASA